LSQWIAILIGVGLISSCAYGPKAERKTPLSYLSGENYETGPGGQADQLVIPVVKRKEQATLIEGRVFAGEGINTVQVRNVQVGLYDHEGHLLLTSTSAEGGQFQFQAPIRNGKYRLKLNSDRYRGEVPLEVSSYTIKDVLIRAETLR
jgi:hypothetical protein